MSGAAPTPSMKLAFSCNEKWLTGIFCIHRMSWSTSEKRTVANFGLWQQAPVGGRAQFRFLPVVASARPLTDAQISVCSAISSASLTSMPR